ncbi:MAG: hypothetical protein LBP87_15485 [Planctomycetaceae bacterium]|jgi:hypothetical protein|nr:hypothetical protein [Planctomycetaceae bacterium]
MKHNNILFILLILFVLFSGCISRKTNDLETQYVEGIVTLDGIPVHGAHIQFFPKLEGSGQEAGGVSGENGFYKLSSLSGDPGKGVLEGEYLVTVAKNEAIELPKPRINPNTGDEETHETKSVLPEIYRNKTKTPIFATVVRGKNKIDIKLESSN